MNVIFEDDDILVLDKDSGVVVNKSETTSRETLQDELSEYLKLGDNLGIGDRAGIVHRLDRETSGVLLVAKTQKAFVKLQEQFKNRQVQKEYVALVHDQIKEQDRTIERPIGRIGGFGRFGIVEDGRESTTEITVLKYYLLPESYFSKVDYQSKNRERYFKKQAKDYTLVLAKPKTGRTHQIRVHLKSISHPVVSDLIYGPAKMVKFDLDWCPRLFLHAKSIEFTHPKTGKPVFFESDLPKDLKDAMLNLQTLD